MSTVNEYFKGSKLQYGQDCCVRMLLSRLQRLPEQGDGLVVITQEIRYAAMWVLKRQLERCKPHDGVQQRIIIQRRLQKGGVNKVSGIMFEEVMLPVDVFPVIVEMILELFGQM